MITTGTTSTTGEQGRGVPRHEAAKLEGSWEIAGAAHSAIKVEPKPRDVDRHLPKAAPQVGGRAGTRLKFAGAQARAPPPHIVSHSLPARLPPKSRVGLSGTGQPRDT